MAINPLFNAKNYLAYNADLIRAGLHTEQQLWDHYVQFGAQESLLDGAVKFAARAPNAWFQLDYYLAANPDLLLNGVTAGTALDHFLNFGIAEGRAFNIDLEFSDFNYVSYADNNADLREAFGIADDFTELTAEQEAALITHYLSFGYAEDRKGVSKDFSDILAAKNVIDVAEEGTLGTIVDDEFRVDGNVANGDQFDGVGGNDTVVFNKGSIGNVGAVTDVALRNIEEVVVNTDLAVTFSSSQVLDSLTLGKAATSVTVNFDANAIAGAGNELDVTTNATAAAIIVNGIETVNLTAGAGTVTTLNANKASGADLTVNVDGGKADQTAKVTVDSTGSAAVETVTINGSAAAGNVDLVAGANLKLVQNIVMNGGAGDDTFTNGTTGVTVDVNFTANGGAGKDTFNASAAIDTFTGGKGDDTFDFTVSANAAVRLKDADSAGNIFVDATDTITDFTAGDTLKLAVSANILTITDTTGIAPTGTELTKLLVGGTNTIFDFDGDVYVVLTQGTDATSAAGAEVIKLAGVQVSDFANIDAAAGTVTGVAGAFVFA